MPREWHDYHAVNAIDDPEKKRFYKSIVADKKPYFMRYIYPALMKQYNTYIKNTNKNALREFQYTVQELFEMEDDELTERQKEFIYYYKMKMPVGINDCVMNRICRRFEVEFDRYLSKHKTKESFDYTILKCGVEYSKSQYNSIFRLYESYNKRLKSFAVYANYERIDECEAFSRMMEMREEFIRECAQICPDKYALCDIILDICYTNSSTKRFAWEMCGDEIIRNLLERNNNMITCPILDDNGDVEYGGNHFHVEQYRLEELDGYITQ